ncbi:hypothetical protein GQ607_006853 [Colletotrichum asianum]|uniref:Uncharacterized protein n=1 Tax=Colletotrichum asianum TaxID=702518 RepID=A0A8H3ZVZ5_9PEZI|nr:hypothetical protein GQ607_006853 [Colletotrichum asianum]
MSSTHLTHSQLTSTHLSHVPHISQGTSPTSPTNSSTQNPELLLSPYDSQNLPSGMNHYTPVRLSTTREQPSSNGQKKRPKVP